MLIQNAKDARRLIARKTLRQRVNVQRGYVNLGHLNIKRARGGDGFAHIFLVEADIDFIHY